MEIFCGRMEILQIAMFNVGKKILFFKKTEE